MLSNFQVGTRSLVQSFLVGQPEFREIMQRPEMRQLKQRVIASYHLGPLDAAETRAYVEHRLRHVGWSSDPAISQEAFDRIHHHSEGVPRRINSLCDRVLLAGFLAELHAIGPGDVDGVAAELAEELGLADQRVSSEGQGGIPTLQASPSGHDQSAGRLAQLEERVARLEDAGRAAHGLLSQMLRALNGADPDASRRS